MVHYFIHPCYRQESLIVIVVCCMHQKRFQWRIKCERPLWQHYGAAGSHLATGAMPPEWPISTSFCVKLTKVAYSLLLLLDFSLPLWTLLQMASWTVKVSGKGTCEIYINMSAVCRYEYANHNLPLTYTYGVAVVECVYTHICMCAGVCSQIYIWRICIGLVRLFATSFAAYS